MITYGKLERYYTGFEGDAHDGMDHLPDHIKKQSLMRMLKHNPSHKYLITVGDPSDDGGGDGDLYVIETSHCDEDIYNAIGQFQEATNLKFFDTGSGCSWRDDPTWIGKDSDSFNAYHIHILREWGIDGTELTCGPSRSIYLTPCRFIQLFLWAVGKFLDDFTYTIKERHRYYRGIYGDFWDRVIEPLKHRGYSHMNHHHSWSHIGSMVYEDHYLKFDDSYVTIRRKTDKNIIVTKNYAANYINKVGDNYLRFSGRVDSWYTGTNEFNPFILSTNDDWDRFVLVVRDNNGVTVWCDEKDNEKVIEMINKWNKMKKTDDYNHPSSEKNLTLIKDKS